MAKGKEKLQDPADQKIEEEGQGALDEEMSTFDPDRQPAIAEDELRLDEIGSVKETKTVAPHPFDGYSLKREVALVGDILDRRGNITHLKVPATYIVLMKPSEEPLEDVSNKGNTIYVSGEPGGGGHPTSGRPKIVDLLTSHTRVIRNRQGQNVSVVFDRAIKVSGHVHRCAIIPEHSVRAQVAFTYDKQKNKIRPDKRYMLADLDQLPRLLELFKALNWQQTKHDRKADQFDRAKEGGAAPSDLVTDEGL